MIALLQISVLGVFTYACAGDFEPMKTIGFVLIIFGMLSSTIAYEKLKERIKKLERQNNKASDIIENNNAELVNDRR